MCDNPHRISYTDFFGRKRWIDAPCCKCVSCLKSQRDGWSIRLYEESKDWQYVYFITLTYRNGTLPTSVDTETGEVISTARIKDVSDALKRFRTSLSRSSSSVRFKYFICSEYGLNGTKRPHYHGLIFANFDSSYLGSFLKDWQDRFGFTQFKRIPFNEMQAAVLYVSKYITKRSMCSRSDDIHDGLIEPSRFVMSKGIGASYIKRMYAYHRDCDVHEMVDRMFYTFDGVRKYPLPRFYKDRFFRKLKYKLKYEQTGEYVYKNGSTFPVMRPRIIKRFTSENFLSVAIADIISARHSLRFQQAVKLAEFKYSDFEFPRFPAVAEVVQQQQTNYRNKADSHVRSMADEVNYRYFTDRHSNIHT